MPILNTISTLESLSLKKVNTCLYQNAFSYFVINIKLPLKKSIESDDYFCWSFCETKCEEFRRLLTKILPPRFHNSLLSYVISVLSKSFDFIKSNLLVNDVELTLDLFKNFLCLMMRCFITFSTTEIDLTSICHSLRIFINENKDIFLCNEKHEYEVLPEDFFTYCLNGSTKEMKNLKYLKVPHFVSNMLLCFIGLNCNDLESLILRCNNDCRIAKPPPLKPYSIPVLYSVATNEFESNIDIKGCPLLKVLYLPDESEHLADICEMACNIFIFMKDIEDLVGVPMAYVLEYIYENYIAESEVPSEENDSLFVNPSFESKLKHFHHGFYRENTWADFAYDQEAEFISPYFNLCSHLFPKINKISLYAPLFVVDEALQAFLNPSEITLFIDETFIEHSKKFNNFVYIDINVSYEEEWPILLTLSSSCMLLEHLVFRSFALEFSGSNETSIYFPCLKHLSCIGQQGPVSALPSVISGSPNLTSISLIFGMDESGDSPLTDQEIINIATCGSKLESFKFKLYSHFDIDIKSLSKVSEKSIMSLIDNCPNLKTFGYMSLWNINETVRESIERMIKNHNWDLELL